MTPTDPATAAAERIEARGYLTTVPNGLNYAIVASAAELIRAAYAPLLQRLADVELLARAATIKAVSWTEKRKLICVWRGQSWECVSCEFINHLPVLTPALRSALESEVGK